MQQEFKKKLDVECLIEIKGAHQASSRQNNTNNPPTIIRNLLRHNDKVKIIQKGNKLRGTHIFLNKFVISVEKRCYGEQ